MEGFSVYGLGGGGDLFRSGDNVHDKAAEFGIVLEPAELVKPMRVSASRLVLECRLLQQVEVADHILYIAEVLGCYGNGDAQGLYATDGYRRLNTVTEISR